MNIRFSDTYRCFSSATAGKPELEETDRILLPDDALNSIYQAGYDNNHGIMLFCIRNIHRGTEVYAGVENFTMPQGQVCLPYWIMEFLQCNDNDLVNISLTTLPRATRALFQPLDSSFFNIPSPKVVLEYTLRTHPCLTQGTIIIIKFNNKSYRLKVLKTEPASAVQAFKADIICDFATPMNEFKHHWNEPDTDSSDEELAPIVKKGQTISGKVVEETETPKPLHSTYAQRENDRLHGNVFRTKEIVQGQEILPPKPREKSSKKEDKVDYFDGQGHIVKKKKGKKGGKSPSNASLNSASEESAPAPKPAPSNQEDKSTNQSDVPKKSYFTGVARNVKGDSFKGEPVKPTPPPAPQQQNENEKKDEQKKSFFSGAARTLKSSTPQSQPSQPAQNPPPSTGNSGSSFFQGPSRKLKH
ncbi:hypothetical protein M9Y10_034960 [Tritrichomonas musculus]|uniref:Ubiquitin fusion degradation protein n=1 Tax=Tritrichomonas musculus TaxID=1915356 RepID=A0ABR2KGD8_9EUKA